MKKADYDSPWKNILNHFLQAFMEFCLPDAASAIDWSKGYSLLDKELQAVGRRQEAGKRIADALFKVYLKSGEEVWLLIHIEVQAQPESHLPERMYIYNYRIFDRYQKPVMSVAILADDDLRWRPTAYERRSWYTTLHFEFATIKLLDYASKKEVLLQQNNPFGIVVWAHLEALKTRKNAEQRFYSKLRITRALYEQGFNKDYILELYAFLDWVLALPEPLEIQYMETVEQLEEERHVHYITSAERIGIQKGMQQGEAALVLRLAQRRFGRVPQSYKQRITQADADTLLDLGEKILEAKTLKDLFKEE